MPPKPPIPASFRHKKRKILSALATPERTYTDKSPKGTVDVQIHGLIEQINKYEGLVTTSSCAGRVAVFVEGPRDGVVDKKDVKGKGEREGVGSEERDDGDEAVNDLEDSGSTNVRMKTAIPNSGAGPGGKGGGRWLYVSHEPAPADKNVDDFFTTLFGLTAQKDTGPSTSLMASQQKAGLPADHSRLRSPPQLIRLVFSPLILHILCATLAHGRPLLAAAINAGFRESGVQSLKALDDGEAGVMVAVRTAGLAFESVIGIAAQREGEVERMQSVVSEEYLRMCAEVVNERFKWNEKRKERFRVELGRAMERERGEDEWEGKDERKWRKREEGLRKKREVELCQGDDVALKNADELLKDGLIGFDID